MPITRARTSSPWSAAAQSVSRALAAVSTLALSALLAETVHADPHSPGFDPQEHEDVCRYILEHAGSVTFLRDHLLRHGVFDANNDGQPEIVEQGATGTMGGDAPRLRSLDGAILSQSYASSEDFEHIRWSFGAAWLPYKGRFYRLVFKEEAARFVRGALYVTPDNTIHAVCRFDNEVTERMSARSGRPEDVAFCQGFTGVGQSLRMEFDVPSQMTVEQLNRHSPGSRHYPRNQATVDFDNDGSEETLLLIEMASGGGRGCDMSYYDLLDQTGSGILDGPRRDLLLALQGVNLDNSYPHRRCNLAVHWVEHDGEVLFEMGYRWDAPSRSGDLVHHLRAVRDSRIEQVCESSFSIRPVLVDGTN